MKLQVIALAASGLLWASASHAAPSPDIQRFLDATHEQAAARLQSAGVAIANPLTVEGRVDGFGRLEGLRVLKSSGSRDADDQALAALRRLAVGGAPPVLSGRDITLTFGGAPIVQAKAP